MDHPVLRVTENTHTNQALTLLVSQYRENKRVQAKEAYEFISLLSMDIHDDVNTLAASQELAKLQDIVQVLRAAKVALESPDADIYRGMIPLEILSMTYHVLASTIENASTAMAPATIH